MNEVKIFSKKDLIPPVLAKEELNNLFILSRNGSKCARDKIVIHNISLVFFEIRNKFRNSRYDENDLISVGIIGLLKSVNTFDLDKNFSFTTYAIKCIDSEIIKFLNKSLKEDKVASIDEKIYDDNDSLKFFDIIADEYDIFEVIETKETNKIIKDILNTLPELDRKVLLMNFGFIDNRVYTKAEIAEKLGINYSYVLILIKKNLRKMRILLRLNGINSINADVKIKKL